MKLYCFVLFYFGYCASKPQGFLSDGFMEHPFGGVDTIESMMTAPEMEMEMMAAPELSMNFNIDPKKVKTKRKTEKKGNVTITETNKTGPNFYMQEVEINGGNNKGSMKELSRFSPFLLGGEPMQWKDLNKKHDCKNCKDSQFCLNGICANKRSEGSTCLKDEECKGDLLCVFGVCNKADDGEGGTQCKKHDDCDEDLCCFPTRSIIGLNECKARLPLGAVCSNSPFASIRNVLPFSFRRRRENQKSCDNPCLDGLKCTSNGNGMEKVCASEEFKFNVVAEIGSGDDDDDEEKNKEKSTKIKVTTGEGVEIPDSNTNSNQNQTQQKIKTAKKGKKQKQRKSKGKKNDKAANLNEKQRQ